jgi:hypothetical protein
MASEEAEERQALRHRAVAVHQVAGAQPLSPNYEAQTLKSGFVGTGNAEPSR